MFKKYLCWLIALPLTVILAGCAIEDDIPYPIVEASIIAFEVEGQCNESGTGEGSAVINYDAHTVQLYVDESVDITRLGITRFEVSNNASIAAPAAVCVRPESFPKEGFKQAANLDETRVNFTSPVQFTLTTYQDYVWTVSVTQVERSEVDIFARSTSATVTGEVKNGRVPTVEYREQEAQNWNQLPENQIQHSGDKFTAELTNLVPGKTYDFRTSNGASATFTTAPALQLPNASFDDWSTSGTGTRVLYMPWADGDNSFWDTGNRGATTVGASNSTGVTEDGRTFANLQSKYIVVKFAAGNIFAGEYLATDGTNGVLGFGRPFESFPTKLTFDYKFKTSPINRQGAWNNAYSKYISRELYEGLKGQPDSCNIYIALLDDYLEESDREENMYDGKLYPWVIRTKPAELHLLDLKSPRIIAYGQFTQGNDVDNWTTQEVVLNYRRTDRKPKYIIVVASSSKYGDYFTGGDKSLLQLDNMHLEY